MIRSHMLGLLVTKLTDLNKDEVESVLDFDKLLDDNEVTDKEPLIIKAAKDNVAHRLKIIKVDSLQDIYDNQVCDGGVQVPGAPPLGGPGPAGEGVHSARRGAEGGQDRVPGPEV